MARELNLDELLERFGAGAEAALARAVSVIEDETPGYEELLHKVYPDAKHILRLGVTGPPGAGKSTLVGRLATVYSGDGETVGIIAVDPTSPFTGGALLGDRIRMDDVGNVPGVFIRSMGTRGSLGGLARSTREVAMVMDAFGKDRVIIETVGVGQSELDIAGAADTTIVVLVPESGDGIQAMKAGLMEIADIVVMNKADREGADRACREIRAILELKPAGGRDWEVPVIPTVARDGEGTDEVLAAIEEHRGYIESAGIGAERRRARAKRELMELLERDILGAVTGSDGFGETIDAAVTRILGRDSTPYREAEEISKAFKINKLSRS
jgi:LAO/AO transport system kinase